MESDWSEHLRFAVEIAGQAGDLLRDRPAALQTSTKSTATDVVTHMDRAAEALLVSRIVEQYPDDGVLGEEGAESAARSGRQWVLDPLDGTVNYVFGLPLWSVSVALVDAATRTPLVGVVHAPEIGMTMAAAAGHGAHRVLPEGPAPLAVSTAQDLSQALVATGFGYDAARRSGQARVLGRVLPQVRDLRRMGSCAIDLCYVAAGCLDGYFERGVHEWDFAAGALIVTEAGGVVSGLRGGKPGPEMVVAAGAALHGQLQAILEQAGADQDRPAEVDRGEP